MPADTRTDLETAITLVANALGMDEAEAFRAPLAFGVRAGAVIYRLKALAAHAPAGNSAEAPGARAGLFRSPSKAETRTDDPETAS